MVGANPFNECLPKGLVRRQREARRPVAGPTAGGAAPPRLHARHICMGRLSYKRAAGLRRLFTTVTYEPHLVLKTQVQLREDVLSKP